MYTVRLTKNAEYDILQLQKHAPKAMKKLAKLLEELKIHPRTGSGKCERLKHYKEETWSRRISKEHRLVYRIYDDVVQILVISVYGHIK